MSNVPKWKRNSDERLDLFLASRDFSIYILKISKNEKIFKPEFKTELTNRLVQDALDIYILLWKANCLNAKTESIERKGLQIKALESITDFVCIWNIAKMTFHFKSNRDVYVMSCIENLKTAIKKWINYDNTKSNDLCVESGVAK